ncbi:MFS general substrate transporter [Westerdykella ornata]|uniref:MFS general substrate transporter n=1 Tax=Westerdykella ornata TaxID=318751 RepID=A0A6A6JA17_WESOR|nr:MFS general substrate transporter [Westerdykella ornata]KAF2273440.1 MFS general substrate transporter [Westerdykella ornata]
MRQPGWLASLTHDGDKPPFLLKTRSSNAFIIGTIALAVFTDIFLYGVIVPVVPFALEQKLNVTQERVQHWVSVLIAIYGASLLAFSPICGWLADHTSSRRSSLLLGLLALLGSTVLLNLGSNVGVFVAGRILQGASAAVVWTVGLALLADTVPQAHLAQAMGYVSLAMTLGILVGPLLGGVVFDRGGYDAVFGMCYGLIGLDIVLRVLLIEKKTAAQWDPNASGRVREIGGVSSSTERRTGPELVSEEQCIRTTEALANLEKGHSSVPQPSTSDINPTPNGISTDSERQRLRDRLPPILSLLYSRRLLAALFASIIQAALITAFDGVLTIHAARIFGWTATGAALLFLPIVIPTFLAPLAGMLSDRIGGRFPASIGFLLATVPLVCLRFVEENSIKDKILLCAMLALIGLTLTFTFPPLMAEISGVVETKEKKLLASGKKGYGKGGAYAQAYALFNVAFAAGCMIGPLIAGAIVEEQGWGTMGWVLGLLSGITSVPVFLWLGGWIFTRV